MLECKAILDVAEFKKILFEVKSRGIKTRYITEINKDNIDKCKQLMELVGSVRHLDGIRANFSTSEIEYLASMTGIQTAKPGPILSLQQCSGYCRGTELCVRELLE